MSTGMQSAVWTATPTPLAFDIRASPQAPFPGETRSATRTSRPCTCFASTGRPAGKPAASKKRLLFSATFLGASPLARPRFSERNRPSLTPPLRVLNPWRRKPRSSSRGEARNSTPPDSWQSKEFIRNPSRTTGNHRAYASMRPSRVAHYKERRMTPTRNGRSLKEKGGAGGENALPQRLVHGECVISSERGPLVLTTTGGFSQPACAGRWARPDRHPPDCPELRMRLCCSSGGYTREPRFYRPRCPWLSDSIGGTSRIDSRPNPVAMTVTRIWLSRFASTTEPNMMFASWCAFS